MDKEILVTDLSRLLTRLEKDKGPVALWMLLGQDASGETWTAVCSASRFDQETRSAALHWLTAALRDAIDEKYLPKISRAAVLRTDDPFVVAMNRAFHISNSSVDIRESNVFGFEIPSAIVFHSESVAPNRIAAG